MPSVNFERVALAVAAVRRAKAAKGAHLTEAFRSRRERLRLLLSDGATGAGQCSGRGLLIFEHFHADDHSTSSSKTPSGHLQGGAREVQVGRAEPSMG